MNSLCDKGPSDEDVVDPTHSGDGTEQQTTRKKGRKLKKDRKSKKIKGHRDVPFTGTLHECNHCNRYFPTMDKLSKHVKDNHSAMLESEGSMDHVYRRTEFGLICKECKEYFSSCDHLQKHVNDKLCGGMSCKIDDDSENEDTYNLECTACSIYFSSEASLHEHQQTHVCEAIADCPCCSAQVRTPNPNVRSIETQTHEFHGCDKCNDTFENMTELRWHLLQKHNVTPIPVRIGKPKRPGRPPLARNTPRPQYNCQFCSEIFKTLKAAKRHHQVHEVDQALQGEIEQISFQCKKCGEKFPLRSKLVKHVRTLHGGKDVAGKMQKMTAKKWVCHKCGQTYGRSSHLKMHMKRHAGIKSFSCQHCPKAFYTSHNLKEHLWTHTGQKPYSCTKDNCFKRFTQKSHLNYHLKSHERKETQVKIKQAQLDASNQNVIKLNQAGDSTLQKEHIQVLEQRQVQDIQTCEQPLGELNTVSEQPQVECNQEPEQQQVEISQVSLPPPQPQVELSQVTEIQQVEIVEYGLVPEGGVVQEEIVDTTPHAVVQVHQQEILYVPLDSHVQEVRREGHAEVEQPQYQPANISSIVIEGVHSIISYK